MANKTITVAESGVSPQTTLVAHGETVDFQLATGSNPVDVYFDSPSYISDSNGATPDPLQVGSQTVPVTVTAPAGTDLGFSVVAQGSSKPSPGGHGEVVRGDLDVTTPPELPVEE